MAEELTPRQAAFVAAYARSGIAEQAAIEAGYSPRTARGSAGRLLANAGIRAELDRLATVTEAATVADLRELREAWTATMRNDGVPWRDRLRASELLGKSLGAFTDKIEHTGPNGLPLSGGPAPVINLTLTTKEGAYPELYGPGGPLAGRDE